jgi:hypothetical protein
MSRFYIDTPDVPHQHTTQDARSRIDSRADERARWDADDRFWRIDTWTDAELCDDARFAHYMANLHVHKRGGPNV